MKNLVFSENTSTDAAADTSRSLAAPDKQVTVTMTPQEPRYHSHSQTHIFSSFLGYKDFQFLWVLYNHNKS